MQVMPQNSVGRGLILDYIALTKPRIILLLLITAIGGMVLASGGLPDPVLALLVLCGGALASGGAQSLNHYLDRDIDRLMDRTENRPVASGRVSPSSALIFGIILNLVAFIVLVWWVSMLSAVLTIGASIFYVLVYTMWLKRTTPQNIVIGGAAGAIPPVVGWVAVTGQFDLPALYLFAIVFFWTPPHFWALSLMIKDDYVRAGIPMLPVVVSLRQTKVSIFLYTLLLVAITLMFFTTSAVGWIYLTGAAGLGVVFVYFAWMLLRKTDINGAKGMYLYSLLYIAMLFVFIMSDSILTRV